MDASRLQDVLTLIRMEYLEMPCLRLTPGQARRLFNLTEESCAAALWSLESTGFLARTRDGSYVRRTEIDMPSALSGHRATA